jgi:16S rRNA (cytosine1402-N4)-methyltransferase
VKSHPRRSTPAGEHRPVLLAEVLNALDPQPGNVMVDCTVGFAGHAVELLQRVGPSGRLVGIDLDRENLDVARARLAPLALPFTLHYGNFAGLQNILAAEGLSSVDGLVADLGMSSMQVDDPERGFSYARDGALDMRMDRTRGKTAAQLVAEIKAEDLRRALEELGDEPHATSIAAAIIAAREKKSIQRTGQLSDLIIQATGGGPWKLHPRPGKWNLHPAARTFQTLRLLVNRELDNLRHLLRVLPACLAPGGRAAIISFHSGEDRLVKSTFRDGRNAGLYAEIADEPVRASFAERQSNPRSRSAKLRWASRT